MTREEMLVINDNYFCPATTVDVVQPDGRRPELPTDAELGSGRTQYTSGKAHATSIREPT